MGLIKKSLFIAAAAKAVQVARKPQNQQKIKEFVASQRASAQSRSTRRTN